MSRSQVHHINKFLCEQCKYFEQFNLDYIVVNNDGKIIAKNLPDPFGKCNFYNRNIGGRDNVCEQFKK